MSNTTTTPAELDRQAERNAWLAALKISWDEALYTIDRSKVLKRLATRLASLSPHPDVTDVDRDEVRTLIAAAKYVTK